MNFNSFFVSATTTSTGAALPSYITNDSTTLYNRTLNLLVVDKQVQLSANSLYTVQEFTLSLAQRLSTLIGPLASLYNSHKRSKICLIKTFCHQLLTGRAYVLVKTKNFGCNLEKPPLLLKKRSGIEQLPLVLQNHLNSFLSYKAQAYVKQSSLDMLQASFVVLNEQNFHSQLLEIQETQRHVKEQNFLSGSEPLSSQQLKKFKRLFPNFSSANFTIGLGSQIGKKNEYFQNLVRSNSGLTSIDIQFGYNVTDESIAVLAQNCPGLTRLHLNYCYEVTHIGLRALSQHCHHLRSLKLFDIGRQDITTQGYEAIIRKCSNLNLIDLSFCSLITDICLQALAETCPNLTSVNLNICIRLTNNGLQTLAQNCHHLASINLCNWVQLTDTALEVVAQHCPDLTALDLSGCENLTDYGLEALTENCPGLTRLNLTDCNQITEAGFQMLNTKCPFLYNPD